MRKSVRHRAILGSRPGLHPALPAAPAPRPPSQPLLGGSGALFDCRMGCRASVIGDVQCGRAPGGQRSREPQRSRGAQPQHGAAPLVASCRCGRAVYCQRLQWKCPSPSKACSRAVPSLLHCRVLTVTESPARLFSSLAEAWQHLARSGCAERPPGALPSARPAQNSPRRI